MVITLKNEDELVYAYFEWDIVDNRGKRDEYGEYMHVREIWVHKDYDGEKVISEFIDMLNNDSRNINIQYIYWLRDNKRLSKTFSRKVALRRIKNVIPCIVN